MLPFYEASSDVSDNEVPSKRAKTAPLSLVELPTFGIGNMDFQRSSEAYKDWLSDSINLTLNAVSSC